MSRIGLKPIEIPSGVEVKFNEDNLVEVKGPKGQLSQKIDKDMKIEIEDGVLTISKTYISKTFNENPEREDIVFTYVFEKNGVLYVAFLSITR